MPNIPKKVIDRLSSQVPKFQRVLKKSKDRDKNEADTVVIVGDILSDVFGFDKYDDVTSEFAIRNTYCDLAIRVDGEIKYLIEVKAIGLGLKDTHLRQAVNYGANEGVQWVVLTNGIYWDIYRILFEKPISHELVVSLNFLELKMKKSEDQAHLFLLCKEGLAKSAIEEYHEHHKHVNRFVIGAIMQSENVTKIIRRDLRKISPGLKIELNEIESILRNDVLKRDINESEEAIKAHKLVRRKL